MAKEMEGDEQAMAHYPSWVVKCGEKVCRALFPKAYELGDPQIAITYKIGVAMGVMQGGEAQFADGISKLGISTENREMTDEEAKKFAEFLYGSDSGLTCPKDGSTLVPVEISQLCEEQLSKMSLREKASFYRGLSDGIAMLAGKNHATDATTPYSTMAIYWRAVETLKSVDQLHEFLTKIHGTNLIGSDIKRTRQLCLRVGKRFRAPGRPKTTSRAK